MLDSTNINDESFDADEFVRSLCKNTKIEISEYAHIHYMSGWNKIIEHFIHTIKNHPIKITLIHDTYLIMDIEFEIIKKTREVNLWRAIHEARNESKLICAKCGSYKKLSFKSKIITMFCEECTKHLFATGKTGTWLDKY